MIYKLKTKRGEIINKCKANSLEEAIEFFSIIKSISKYDLLNIYNVSD